MPGLDGIETIKKMLAIQPNQRIILLTGDYREDRQMLAFQAGAYGCIRKDADPDELIRSIQKVSRDEPIIAPQLLWKLIRHLAGVETDRPKLGELSEREVEILRYLTLGYTDQKIAEELFLTTVTIRTHISRILRKLGVRNRVEAALYGLRSGLVRLEDTSTSEDIL